MPIPFSPADFIGPYAALVILIVILALIVAVVIPWAWKNWKQAQQDKWDLVYEKIDELKMDLVDCKKMHADSDAKNEIVAASNVALTAKVNNLEGQLQAYSNMKEIPDRIAEKVSFEVARLLVKERPDGK